MLQFSLGTNLQSICLLLSMCQIEGSQQAYAFAVLPSTGTVYTKLCSSEMQSRVCLATKTFSARNMTSTESKDRWVIEPDVP